MNDLNRLERQARNKARDDNRRDCFKNPYQKGSFQALMYESEANKIRFEWSLP